MISIKQIYREDIELCYELDSKSISLWSKTQWDSELKKEGVKAFGILYSNLVVGICVSQMILDEVQINYFVINQKFRERGFGYSLMSYLIKHCKKCKIKKLLLEVSTSNTNAEKFYSRFDFSTVGMRKKYYKDGSDALLKEKILVNKK